MSDEVFLWNASFLSMFLCTVFSKNKFIYHGMQKKYTLLLVVLIVLWVGLESEFSACYKPFVS